MPIQGPITYNLRTGRYHSRFGGFLSNKDVQDIIGEEQSRLERHLLASTKLMVEGTLSKEKWRQTVIQETKLSSIRTMVIGAGGDQAFRSNPYQSHYFDFLQADLNELAISTDEILNKYQEQERTDGQMRGWVKYRSSMVHRSFTRSELITRVSRQGANEAKRTPDPLSDHCPQCPGHSTRGQYVPIEDVVAVGSACVCGGRCRCRIHYRFNPERALYGANLREMITKSDDRHSAAIANHRLERVA